MHHYSSFKIKTKRKKAHLKTHPNFLIIKSYIIKQNTIIHVYKRRNRLGQTQRLSMVASHRNPPPYPPPLS